MIKLTLFLISLLVLASAFPLSPNEVLVYQVELFHQNEVAALFNYTFVINSIQDNFVNFTVIITNEEGNNGSVFNTYVSPLNELKILPVNGTVFNGQNFTFTGFVKYKGQNASVYKGFFLINGLQIPSTAYFVNDTLVYLNGSTQGYYLSVSLNQKYSLVSSSYSAYIIIGIVIAMMVLGVVALIKIGKI